MAPKIRLQICHHNRLFRECLASALEGDGSIDVHTTGEAGLGASTAAGAEERDVLLVDASLSDAAGVHLVQAVRAAGRGTRIILIVQSTAPQLVESCLRAGADGCVADDDTLDDLRRAIEIVMSGQSYCSPQVAHRLFARDDGGAAPANGLANGRGCNLTMREHEILRMIAYGNLSNKQIARELTLSIYTVKNHVHSIIEKLGAEDRQAAARHAIRSGLVSRSTG
jgi:DNA-binding NarL/FixJ family response regulator